MPEYDDPRAKLPDTTTESLEEITARTKGDPQSPTVDIDWDSLASLELPGADLSGEELTVRIVPKQDDEFLCTGCFLVHHHTRRHRANVCVDCG